MNRNQCIYVYDKSSGTRISTTRRCIYKHWKNNNNGSNYKNRAAAAMAVVLANLQIYEWNQRIRYKFHSGVLFICCCCSCCINIAFIVLSFVAPARAPQLCWWMHMCFMFFFCFFFLQTPKIYFNKLCKFQQKLNHPPRRIGSRAVCVQRHQPKTLTQTKTFSRYKISYIKPMPLCGFSTKSHESLCRSCGYSFDN